MAKKTTPPPLKLVPDVALGEFEAAKTSELGFESYSEILSDAATNTPGPFTIGVFGSWGTGKTSLMRRVRQRIDKKSKANAVTVWFNAWQYERDANPIIPLVATIIKALEDEKGGFRKGCEALGKALRAIAYGFTLKAKAGATGFEGEAEFSAKDMIDRLGKLSDPLLERSLYYDAFELLSKATKAGDGPKIIVFIDDLDRCLLDKALEVLEYIKLVLAQPGFIFFLGLDRRIIEAYLEKRFQKDYRVKDFRGREYLDKLVQLSFPIPPHTRRIEDFTKYIVNEHLQDTSQQAEFLKIAAVIAEASCANPRAVIRLINNLLVDQAIDKSDTKQMFGLNMLAFSRILQERKEWEEAFALLLRNDFKGEEFIAYLNNPSPAEDTTRD